jgi:co-chaperonin GroES (HSP10)
MDKTTAYGYHKVEKLIPLSDNIIVTDMKFDQRITHGGIVLLNDDMKSSGIRPRWAKVYAIGPEQKDVQIGQYVLISHGRWTRGVKINDTEGEKVIRRIDPNDILLISETQMQDETISDKAI